MKLHLSLLEKLIALPSSDLLELRHLLDDLGLEVKGIEGEGVRAIFNIETLANRGDHLCALGVAREISARVLTAIHYPSIVAEFSQKKCSLPLSVVTPQCLRYALLEMTLPSEMKLRSDVASVMQAESAQGSSEKHPIVDLLNFLLLEIGQPMHAFDRDKVEGEIVVDQTSGTESVQALDGKTYQVPSQSIVIRDKKKIIAVAGVIGCANSMVSPATTRVLIESACFDPIHVRKTARAMGISTDASYAFERGSDIEMVVWALRRLVSLAQGVGGVVKDQDSAHVIGFSVQDKALTEKRKISFSAHTLRQQLNLSRLPELEVTSRLKNLGYVLEPGAAAGQFAVQVPSWRLWDVRNEEDVIEDFARSHGLSRVKLELPPLDYEVPDPSPLELLMSKVEPVLWGQGFCEVMTKSFYANEQVKLLSQLDKQITAAHVSIKNALESNNSHLKITNTIHLAQLAEMNHRRGVQCVKVYELGRLFSLSTAEGSEYQYERDTITLAASGRWFAHDWQKPESMEQCLFAFKGVLESVGKALGYDMRVGESDHALLHPGIQGSIKFGRSICGYFGLIHPSIKIACELKNDLLYAELDVSRLLSLSAPTEREALSEFPAVKRDITVKIDERMFASKILRFVEELHLPNLAQVEVTDHFRRAEERFRRLTLRLTFQSKERTLAHAEVDGAMESALSGLKEKHQIELA